MVANTRGNESAASRPIYDNPRGLPEKWVENYLNRDRAQLAVDVMRAFDAHYQQRRSIRWMKLALALLGTLNAFLATVLALVKLLKFL